MCTIYVYIYIYVAASAVRFRGVWYYYCYNKNYYYHYYSTESYRSAWRLPVCVTASIRTRIEHNTSMTVGGPLLRSSTSSTDHQLSSQRNCTCHLRSAEGTERQREHCRFEVLTSTGPVIQLAFDYCRFVQHFEFCRLHTVLSQRSQSINGNKSDIFLTTAGFNYYNWVQL